MGGGQQAWERLLVVQASHDGLSPSQKRSPFARSSRYVELVVYTGVQSHPCVQAKRQNVRQYGSCARPGGISQVRFPFMHRRMLALSNAPRCISKNSERSASRTRSLRSAARRRWPQRSPSSPFAATLVSSTRPSYSVTSSLSHRPWA